MDSARVDNRWWRNSPELVWEGRRIMTELRVFLKSLPCPHYPYSTRRHRRKKKARTTPRDCLRLRSIESRTHQTTVALITEDVGVPDFLCIAMPYEALSPLLLGSIPGTECTGCKWPLVPASPTWFEYLILLITGRDWPPFIPVRRSWPRRIPLVGLYVLRCRVSSPHCFLLYIQDA